jgi:hypothetical protein
MAAAFRALCSVSCCILLGSVGCAHHRKDQYAYAPPYAPPVYPQPVSYQQPVAAGAAMPAPPVVAGVPGPVTGPPAMAGTPCEPAVQPVSMQGSPCPPGEYIVPGSMVGEEMPCTPCQ